MTGPDDKRTPGGGGTGGGPDAPPAGSTKPASGGADGASPPGPPPKPPAGAAPPSKPPAPPAKPAPKPDPLKEEVPSVPRDRLRQAFADEIEDVAYHAAEVTVRMRTPRLHEVLSFLRDDDACRMDLLIDLCAADYPDRERRFDVSYHLYSIPRGHFLRVKASAAEGEELPSVTGIWATADWFEREIFDLFGVPFADHPDLRRILMPEHWRGHPLRKDYPLAGYPDQHLRLR